MTLSNADSILSKHPFFKSLDDDTKIGIYNKIATKIFYLRSDITIINRKTYSTDKSYLLYHKHLDDVNLSAHKDIDSLMNEHSLLKNLTDQQKIAIFEIAAYRINMYRTLREDQEYFFDTHKEDVYYRLKRWFQPILIVASKILSYTTKTLIFQPLLVVNATVLTLLSSTKYFIPLLTATSKVWTFVRESITLIPLVELQAKIVQDKNITKILLPKLIVSFLLLLGSKTKTVTYIPQLAVSYDIITDADYTKIITLQPLLVMSYQITK